MKNRVGWFSRYKVKEQSTEKCCTIQNWLSFELWFPPGMLLVHGFNNLETTQNIKIKKQVA